MYSRRNVRIKVMQAIYASEQNEKLSVDQLKDHLLWLLHLPWEILLYNLYMIQEIADYSEVDASIKSSKYLPTEKDKLASSRLVDNYIISTLRISEPLQDQFKKYKFHIQRDKSQIKRLFQDLSENESYLEYLAKSQVSRKEDKQVLLLLLWEVMLQNEIYLQHLEERFPTWFDDDEMVVYAVEAMLKSARKDHLAGKLEEYREKINESEEFAVSLLEKTLPQKENYAQLIAPKLQNWEVDRIAKVDMILMEMAVCEILEFPNIPVKVTINEYVDISKMYSTPKSREFINGVLDKLMKELKEEGKIFKSGRGLLNN